MTSSHVIYSFDVVGNEDAADIAAVTKLVDAAFVVLSQGVAVGIIGELVKVFIPSTVSSPVSWTTSLSFAFAVSSLAISSVISVSCQAVITSSTLSPASNVKAF